MGYAYFFVVTTMNHYCGSWHIHTLKVCTKSEARVVFNSDIIIWSNQCYLLDSCMPCIQNKISYIQQKVQQQNSDNIIIFKTAYSIEHNQSQKCFHHNPKSFYRILKSSHSSVWISTNWSANEPMQHKLSMVNIIWAWYLL